MTYLEQHAHKIITIEGQQYYCYLKESVPRIEHRIREDERDKQRVKRGYTK